MINFINKEHYSKRKTKLNVEINLERSNIYLIAFCKHFTRSDFLIEKKL
jgi:hypothetical protein